MKRARPTPLRPLGRLPAPLGVCLLLVFALGACATGEPPEPGASSADAPAILLVTLDTTRADVMGFESGGLETPHLDALAGRGQWFAQAYTTAPMTLPSHTSMLTGLYPGEHGIHENSRRVDARFPLLGERLHEAGYETAAFLSALPLARQFGLDRGFDRYDDDFGDSASERRADVTTDRALAYLAATTAERLFLWVHYFDPHEPYDPPEPFRSRFAESPYRGEIAFMDQQVGRLVSGFEVRLGDRPTRILVVGDHGEGLGEHGENLHGSLLYQGVVRVPLIVVGEGLSAQRVAEPVSVRRVFDTVLNWAGVETAVGGTTEGPRFDLLSRDGETVLAEAMKPFLQYGWQPQVMAVRDGVKIIRSGHHEIYDLAADPDELHDLADQRQIHPEMSRALEDYPLPMTGAADADEGALSRDDRERLASLGYVGSSAPTGLRDDAPDPRDMAFLFDALDRGSALFVQRRYAEAIPLFEEVLARDPGNFVVALRLAVAHSVEGHPEAALEHFRRAESLEPASLDLKHYLAMHHLRQGRFELAAPLFEEVLAAQPERLPALESLAKIREREGRLAEAASLTERVVRLENDPLSLLQLGQLRMGMGETEDAIVAFERAREQQGDEFPADLQLGVLYLAASRLPEAALSLDRVPADHPGYPMALFKRAQVSVLLAEPDRAERVRLASQKANATTRQLIEREPLFSDLGLE